MEIQATCCGDYLVVVIMWVPYTNDSIGSGGSHMQFLAARSR